MCCHHQHDLCHCRNHTHLDRCGVIYRRSPRRRLSSLQSIIIIDVIIYVDIGAIIAVTYHHLCRHPQHHHHHRHLPSSSSDQPMQPKAGTIKAFTSSLVYIFATLTLHVRRFYSWFSRTHLIK